jgi:hypothetical protein
MPEAQPSGFCFHSEALCPLVQQQQQIERTAATIRRQQCPKDMEKYRLSENRVLDGSGL